VDYPLVVPTRSKVIAPVAPHPQATQSWLASAEWLVCSVATLDFGQFISRIAQAGVCDLVRIRRLTAIVGILVATT